MNTSIGNRVGAINPLPLYQAETLEHQGTREYERKNWQKAITLLEQSLEIRQGERGSKDPGVARLLDKIGLACFAQNLLPQAADKFKRAQELLEGIYYPAHGAIAPVLEHHGDVLWKEGKLVEAASTFQRAQEIYAKTETMENRDTLRTMLKLARLYLVMHQPEPAEAIIDKALKHVDTPLGPVAEFRYQLALAYIQEGKTNEASSLFAACVEQFRQRHNYARVVDCVQQLKQLSSEKKDPTDLDTYRELGRRYPYPDDIFLATLLRA